MVTRGVFKCVWVSLAILGAFPEISRAADPVVLTGWAGEGSVIRGSGMNLDVFVVVAEAGWDQSAPRDNARYKVRVAYPDGRVDTRDFPVDYPPGRRRIPIYFQASSLRDQVPSAVQAAVAVVDSATGTPVSNTLMAGIDQFPRAKGDPSTNDPGPFGWGKPLEGEERILPSAGPDGLRFARIAGSAGAPGFFLATTESTIGQVAARLPGYDPKAGRSDEFALEDPDQPAINLTPAKALEYLKALGAADASGVSYRLPTSEEWTRAAKAGKATAFWWGDEPTFPEGANLLGREPGLLSDGTATSIPATVPPTFKVNPLGLAHTYGNVAEWATDPSGGFARMGGHFRTEPASPMPEVKVDKPDELGPDPFVGVRAEPDLTPETAVALIRKRLATDPGLAGVAVAFDAEKAQVELGGSVADSKSRRSADQKLEGLWFVASVENRVTTAALVPNQLAGLGALAGPVRRVAVLDRTFIEIPLTVRWFDPLPVQGSSWWVNVFLPGGAQVAHKLDPGEPGRATKVIVRVDRSQLAALGLLDTSPIQVALSLGSASPTPSDSKIVSNLLDIRPTFPAKSR